MQRNSTLRSMTECAIMIAAAVVLSLIPIIKLPQGGSVTLVSMLPVIVAGLRNGPKWGLLTAFTYSLLQMLMGFYPPPVKDFLSFALVVLLDYVVAFTVLGLAPVIAARFRSVRVGATVSAGIVIMLRFVCHFFSGILIWHEFAGDLPVWLYSLGYNGSYIGVELVLTVLVIAVLAGSEKVIPRISRGGKNAADPV